MPRGLKICPECDASVGPRTKICECGHEFIVQSPRKAPSRKPPRIPAKEPFKNLTEGPGPVVGIRDRRELDLFIDQLRECQADSDRTGGSYSAFLRHQNGTLQVEVWLSLELK